MSLVEVCVGLFLFTLVAGGLISSLIHTRRLAIAALYESSALVSASGYMEQMKAMAHVTLLQSCKTVTTPAAIPAVTGTGGASPLLPSTDSVTNVNTRIVDIFGHYNQATPPAGAKDVMTMTYTVKITNISTATEIYDERLLIQLNYTWDTPYFGGSNSTRSGSLSLVRNNVQTIVN